MTPYFSFENSKELCYLFNGNLSRSEIQVAEALNTLADLTGSRYHYTRKPASETAAGEVVAVYPVSHFFQRGSLLVKASTLKNPGTDFNGGEERVGDVSVNISYGGISKGLYEKVQKYFLQLEQGTKAEQQ